MIKIAILGIENSHAWHFASALAPKEGEKRFPDFELIGFYGESGREDVKVGMDRLSTMCSCTRYAEHYDDFLGEADAVVIQAVEQLEELVGGNAAQDGDELGFVKKFVEIHGLILSA